RRWALRVTDSGPDRLVGVVQQVTRLADQVVLEVHIDGVGVSTAVAAQSAALNRGEEVALHLDRDGLAYLPAD
ncbi:MAG: TOBE domain-containing protein, partial [Ornithinimicrobium sp.]